MESLCFYGLELSTKMPLKRLFFAEASMNSFVFDKSDLIWYINWTAIYAVAFFGDRFRLHEI